MPIFNKSRAIIEKFPPRMGKSTSNHPWRRRLLSLHYGRYGCAYPHRAQPTRRHTLLKNPLQQRKNNGASSSILWFTNALLDNREAGYSFAKASVTHMRHTLTLLANRNLQVLLLSQMIFVAGGAMTVTVGGIIGSQLAPTQALSTLPLSLTVLGTRVRGSAGDRDHATIWTQKRVYQRRPHRFYFVLTSHCSAHCAGFCLVLWQHTAHWFESRL